MQFRRIEPKEGLNAFVECFWTVEGAETEPVIQKIIPDGYPEIIFHFGDPYKIKLKNVWDLQTRELVAGQITSYFHLQNTGRSQILGIKLKPAALSYLLNTPVHSITDRVEELASLNSRNLNDVADKVRSATDSADRIRTLQQCLLSSFQNIEPVKSLELTLASIFESRGMISVAELCNISQLAERQLERLFRKHVGVSPKFYARIIRFNHIFQLATTRKLSLSELGLESGYYDQPHFIRNFKAFTGEDPSRYFFDEPTMANFFLKKVKDA